MPEEVLSQGPSQVLAPLPINRIAASRTLLMGCAKNLRRTRESGRAPTAATVR